MLSVAAVLAVALSDWPLRTLPWLIDTAVASHGSDADAATEAADTAITLERWLEHAYYAGMADLLEVEDRNERIARREIYRSCSRLGETVVDVAERVVYAVMKES